MSSPKKDADLKKKGSPPATTAEGREKQLVGLAIDLAEKQLREGTASSQVIAHFLKLGSSTVELEKEVLSTKKEYMQTKMEEIKSGVKQEELYKDAIKAIQKYKGVKDDEEP